MRAGLISRHGDFRRLWIGNAVSQVGTQVSMLAVPLLAVLTLRASTFQVGALTAAENAAFLLVGLPAGAWVDRLRRRPLLIAGDVLRAALLASVPLAAALGVPSLVQLYAVVVAVGVGTVFFDVAYQSYLPSLVGRQHLVEANGRLEGWPDRRRARHGARSARDAVGQRVRRSAGGGLVGGVAAAETPGAAAGG
jgi:MFS family permease